ncbi:MAG: glycosyltransferase family 4 protein [bacterium]
MRKTILLISHSSSLTGGGEEDFFRLLKHLKKNYNIISIIPEGPRAKEFSELSDKSLLIPNKIFPINIGTIKEYVDFIIKSVMKLIKIFPFLSKNRVDVCFINSSVCFVETLPLIYNKIPFVVSVKEVIKPDLIRKLVYKLFDRFSSIVIFVSKYTESDYFKLTGSKKSLYNPSCIEEDYYNEIFNKSEILNKENKIRIINIGGFYSLKGQDILFEAAEKISGNNFEIKFIGKEVNTDFFNLMKTKISSSANSRRYNIAGELSKEEIIGEYRNADIFVISSRIEGMPLVLLEALHLGVPIIASNVGIVSEVIINNENGFIFEPGDTEALSKYLKKLIEVRELRKKFSENAKTTYPKYFNLKRSLENIERELTENI